MPTLLTRIDRDLQEWLAPHQTALDCAVAAVRVAGKAVGTLEHYARQGVDCALVALAPVLMGRPDNLKLWRASLRLARSGLKGRPLAPFAGAALATWRLRQRRA